MREGGQRKPGFAGLPLVGLDHSNQFLLGTLKLNVLPGGKTNVKRNFTSGSMARADAVANLIRKVVRLRSAASSD